MKTEDVIERLGLHPHPEGGFYRETYRSAETLGAGALPARYGAARCFATAIYYMLTPATFSALHRVRTDEIFHFYLGDPVTMLQLSSPGHTSVVTLGSDLRAGQLPQVVVPAGTWQGAMLAEGGAFALMGTTVAPGFEFDDFELGEQDALVAQYYEQAELIRRLTA